MRNRITGVSVGLVAVAIMLAATTTAFANRLRVTETRFRITWTPVSIIGGTNTVRCNLTLEGSFHSATFAKVREQLVGHISRGTLNTCTGGSATLLRETLPWHVRYLGFIGTLPVIRALGFTLVGMGLRVQPTNLVACLMGTTATEPASWGVVLGGSGEMNNFAWQELFEIALDGFLCAFAGSGHLSGNGVPTVLGSAEMTIRVTLI